MLAACTVALALCVTTPCFAQESVEASEQQIELNDQALEAMNDGNYVRAASLLEEANHLGELNVSYLNLGRAYQHMGRCDDARQALQRALAAPQVGSPPPDLVQKKAREYLADVDDSCEQDQVAEPVEDDGLAAEPTAVDSSGRTWGYVALGTGAALMVGAGLLEWQAISLRDDIQGADADGDGFADDLTRRQALDKQDDANLYDTLALSGAVAGGALVGTGLYLILRSDTSQQLSLAPGPNSFSVSWTLRY
ncbi:MAG: hypothetical protein ACLFVJ_19365 [Persicimonas sp.]